MSFQEPRDAISICNRALGRIAQAPISGSLDNPITKVMRDCALYYKTVVRTLLEQHHFGLATKRAQLVAVTNNRSSEWVGAFAPPTDMAFPVQFAPYSGVASVSYYRGIGALFGMLSGRKIFEYASGVIYTNLSDVELEYVSFNITEADFTQTFENLVVVFLASELARSIAKDPKLAQDLYDEGMAKLNWAIAQNLNIGRPTYGNGLTETELARGGFPVDVPQIDRFL